MDMDQGNDFTNKPIRQIFLIDPYNPAFPRLCRGKYRYSVSGKTVKLIDNDGIQCVFVTVCNQPLKLSTVVVGTALRPVNMHAYDGVAVVCREFIAGLKLAFIRLLPLTAA